MLNENLNIVYSSDNNYCAYMGVSISSVLENNRNFKNINLFIIDNDITIENKNKLISLVKSYNRQIFFIDFNKYKRYLNLNMEWDISISSYARLFVCSILPLEIQKVLYFDCDTIIVDNLEELWNENIDEFYVAGVCDTVPSNVKKMVGLKSTDFYINAGMLLINLKKWREDNLENKFLEFIDGHNGNVIHHDQGVINGVIKNKKILPVKYNLMTSYYMMKREEIVKFYNVEDEFYNNEEIKEAIKSPVYIHYTPGFTTRPWVKRCKHPKVDLFWKYLRITPWKDLKPIKNNEKARVKIVNWIYLNIPFNMADKFCKFVIKILKK